jgi:transcription termination factor Rho
MMKEYNLVDLEEKDLPALKKIAVGMELAEEEVEGSTKHNLIFKILEAQAKKQGLLFSEGVLECLEDGFGFLRAPEFSYLPSQDDIYVSPWLGNSSSGRATRSQASSGPRRTARSTSP